MKFLDPNHPFFRKVWVRWVTALAPMAWGAFEFWMQQPFWGIIFIAAGAYAYYTLIVKGPDQTS